MYIIPTPNNNWGLDNICFHASIETKTSDCIANFTEINDSFYYLENQIIGYYRIMFKICTK